MAAVVSARGEWIEGVAASWLGPSRRMWLYVLDDGETLGTVIEDQEGSVYIATSDAAPGVAKYGSLDQAQDEIERLTPDRRTE